MDIKIQKRGRKREGTAPQSRPDQTTAVSDLVRRMNDESRPDYGPVRSDPGNGPVGEVPDTPLEGQPGGPMAQPSSEQETFRNTSPLPGENIPVVSREQNRKRHPGE